ncbi:MAG TPA: ABC transporter ATP-binding protein [Ktedonobacterales bacterium]|nr:ABC transporter ATP-binding protein [Ktedonobacterales bacterium]
MEITITDLTKTYSGKVQALRGVNLRIQTGMFGLLGPNGAGKTTLMRILAGILQPTGGQAFVGDYNLAVAHDRTAVKRVLGYLPQELGIYPDLSAREFLDYIALLKGLDVKAQRQRRVQRMLDLVSLTDAAHRKLKTFSGGMKRRVGIAQALLNDPQLLIVDEPTAGLDPEERIRFRNLLSELGGDRVVILSTHIVEDIAQTCQNVAIMTQGQVIFSGTTFDLVQAARGRVWHVVTSGQKPEGDVMILSTIHQGNEIHYRVLGTPARHERTTPAEPGLEDGYMWLMRAQQPAHSLPSTV